MKKNKVKMLFICSPSLGILDNWISVMYEIKQNRDDFEFIFFAPNSGTIEQINLDAPLIKIASKVFDKVIFQSYDGLYLKSDNFQDAKEQHKTVNKKFYTFISKVFYKLRITFLNNFINTILKKLITSLSNVNVFNIKDLDPKETTVLYDISESTKLLPSEILTTLNESKKYSICHGNVMHDHLIELLKENPRSIKTYPNKDTTVFAFSKNDLEYHKLDFHVEDKNLNNFGIPRHEKKWMNFFISECEKDYEVPFNGKYIFIISRRDGSMVPRVKKMKFIKEVKNLADKYNLNIVVTKHPQELNDDSYEKVLGIENYGKSWIISNLHSFFIGKYCKFAVSYYSGICSDMIMLDIPTIERVDSEDAYKNKYPNPLIDENTGNCLTEYSYFNVALRASNEEELKKQVFNIMNNREEVMDKLKIAYKNIFTTKSNVNKVISDIIIENLV